MLFNSYDFLVFMPLFFVFYWTLFRKNLKAQNLFILLGSYIFYGWWDWRFLSLIAFSSLVDYLVGIGLGKTNVAQKRKLLLGLSIAVNLGLLGFFKYFNFFLDSTIQMVNAFGFQANPFSLQLILPVGISFYTFQTMSYTIDIYRGKLEPSKDPIAFFAYVSFFPQLVAGPIERASNLLPQFSKNRIFQEGMVVEGMRQILWGLFKKVVIADNCALFVNQVFADPSSQPASNLVIGAVFFGFQIYGDFSGYSDMAIGLGKLLGFRLMKNFAYPYFSRDIAEFWRRWHISLSTWFRDYLYIPLGGSKVSRMLSIRNIFIIFLVSGFWHGANWTFLVWGGINALFFIPLFWKQQNRQHLEIVAKDKSLPSFSELRQILGTFALTTLAWIFFRSDSISSAGIYLIGIFDWSLFSLPTLDIRMYVVVFLIMLLIGIEWKGRHEDFPIQTFVIGKPAWARYGLYYGLTMMVILFAARSQEFIYFQF